MNGYAEASIPSHVGNGPPCGYGVMLGALNDATLADQNRIRSASTCGTMSAYGRLPPLFVGVIKAATRCLIDGNILIP